VAAARTFQRGRWKDALRLLALVPVALMLVGCSTGSPTGGDIHLRISKAFDNRATEENMWNSGTITADGVFSAAKLDTMDMGVIYDGNDIGPAPWTASTNQQSGDFTGDCNGGECQPCSGTYGGSWPIPSVDFTVQERGNGRYVIDLWLGNDLPPRTAGCPPMVAGPVTWSDNLTVTLTGIGSATPAGTADGYTIEVTQ
jgi:hypothetical protein